MARKAKSTALEDSITEGFKIAHTPVAEENQTTEEAPATKKRTTKKKKAEEPEKATATVKAETDTKTEPETAVTAPIDWRKKKRQTRHRMARITMCFADDVYEMLKAESEKQGISMGVIVNEAVRQLLKGSTE